MASSFGGTVKLEGESEINYPDGKFEKVEFNEGRLEKIRFRKYPDGTTEKGKFIKIQPHLTAFINFCNPFLFSFIPEAMS